MQGGRIHVIDFEGSRTSGILEYGVVTLEDTRPVEFHTRLCAPRGPISARDRATHGIDAARIGGQPPFADDWPLFSRLRSSGPLCAHNAAVEDGLLRDQWPMAGTVPDFSRPARAATTWGPWIDTLELARRYRPGLGSYRLDHLVSVFGLEQALAEHARRECPDSRRRYHCALYDAIASALILAELTGKVRADAGALQRWVIDSAASANSRDRLDQRELFD